MIVIIDYGMGNLGSIVNMIKRLGLTSKVSSDSTDIESADKLILPGVGAFDAGMKNLIGMGLSDIINKKVLQDKTPILGICLGMQLMTKRSEEGKMRGLGWIDAETVKFKFKEGQNSFKIPHMGWNYVDMRKEHHLFGNMGEKPRFYFVHSYHAVCNDEEDILATTDYGYDFVSAFQRDNIIGVQFHPEKSHKFGMQVLRNFIGL